MGVCVRAYMCECVRPCVRMYVRVGVYFFFKYHVLTEQHVEREPTLGET